MDSNFKPDNIRISSVSQEHSRDSNDMANERKNIFYSKDFLGDAQFESAGFFTANRPWRHTSRIIQSYEIILMVKGNLPLEINGVPCEFHPNELAVIPPGVPHNGYKISEGPLQFIWLHFTCPSLRKTGRSEILPSISKAEQENLLILPTRAGYLDMHSLYEMAHQLLHIYQNHVSQSYLNTYLTSILYEISYQTLKVLCQEQLRSNDMQPVQEWIRIHSSEHITLEEIAGYFQYNKSYLSRKFKETIGIGISQQITEYRISSAKNLLSGTNMTIQEIAYAVGYDDPKYFLRIFKQKENNTPSEYRRTFNQKHFNKE